MPPLITKLESGKNAGEVIARTATGKVVLLRDSKGALPGHHAEIEITQERDRVCFGRVVKHAPSLLSLKHGSEETRTQLWLDTIATMDAKGASLVEGYLPGKSHAPTFQIKTQITKNTVQHFSASPIFMGKMLGQFPTWGQDFEGFTPDTEMISIPWGTDHLSASEVEDFLLDTPVRIERRLHPGIGPVERATEVKSGDWTIRMVQTGRIVSTQQECHPSGWYERYIFKSGESVIVPSFAFIEGRWHWKPGFVPTTPAERASWIASQEEISSKLKVNGIAAVPMLYSQGKAVPAKAFWQAAYEAGLVSVEGIGARAVLRCGNLDAGPFWAEVEGLAWNHIEQSILASPDRHRLTTLPSYAGHPLFEGSGYEADLEWYKDQRQEALDKLRRHSATPSLPTWNIPWSQSNLHHQPGWDAVVDIIARASHLRMHSIASH